MAKFSVGVEEEGPSIRTAYKRRRTTFSTLFDVPEEEQHQTAQAGEPEAEQTEEHHEEEEAEIEEEEGHEEEDEEANAEGDQDNSQRWSLGSQSNGGNNETGRNSAGSSREGTVSLTLTDPEVLDCCICYEPLSIPVFQCDNGHIACSSCCTKLKNKCPSCSLPIGYNRCRAIEKVLESVKISCQYVKYGCKEIVNFGKKKDHEKTCIYAPCSCPFTNCIYTGSPKQLSEHFSSMHSSFVTCFRYNCHFLVSLTVNTPFFILQEESGDVFVLNNAVELIGNAVSVYCIRHCSLKGGFFYEIQAGTQGGSLRLQSFTRSVQGKVVSSPATGFLLVPCDFFSCRRQLKLKVCIWHDGTCPTQEQKSNDAD